MNPLKSIPATIILGFVAAIVIALIDGGAVTDAVWSLTVWLHVFFGVIWIGLLYYFNFVQVPSVAAAAADSGGPGPAAINKYVAPRALLWFRWGAVATWLTGAAALESAGWGLVSALKREIDKVGKRIAPFERAVLRSKHGAELKRHRKDLAAARETYGPVRLR